MNFRNLLFLPLLALVWVVTAVPASAEIVVLSSKRTLSVKSHRIDGDSIVLTLRCGGEVTCDKSLIEKILPDEVPHPEPQAQAEPQQPRRRCGAGDGSRAPGGDPLRRDHRRRCPRPTAWIRCSFGP